jgi:hypothetical protein
VTVRVAGWLVTRSPRHGRALLGGALVSMVVFAALAAETRAGVPVVGIVLSLAVAWFAASSRDFAASSPRHAAIELGDQQIEIDGRRLDRSAIVSAHREIDLLHIELADGTTHELRAPAAEIDSLIEALGFGHGRRVQRFVVGGYASIATQRLATIALLVMVTLAVPLVFALLFSIVLAAFAHRPDEVTSALVLALPAIVASATSLKLYRAARRVPVYVGADAVRVHGRVFPLSRARARTVDQRMIITSGLDEVTVTCASPREASTLERAIEDARHGRTRSEVDTTQLARGGDGVDTWKSRLIALLDGGAYRATISPDELAQVAEDPSSPAEIRIAAALALSSLSRHSPQRARVRVALEAVAAPKLRVALERAEAGELDTQALEELARDRE